MRSLRGASSSGRHKAPAAAGSRHPTPPASVAADAAAAEAAGAGEGVAGGGGAGSRQPTPAPDVTGAGAAGDVDAGVSKQGPAAMQVDGLAPSAQQLQLQQELVSEALPGAAAGAAAAAGTEPSAAGLQPPPAPAAAANGGQQEVGEVSEPTEAQRELLASLVEQAVRVTEGYTLQQLQGVYARCSRQLAGIEQQGDREAALAALQRSVMDLEGSRRG